MFNIHVEIGLKRAEELTDYLIDRAAELIN